MAAVLRGAILTVTACGGAVASHAPSPIARPAHHAIARAAIDPMTALVHPGEERMWIAPGAVQLDLGAAAIEIPRGGEAIEVVPIDEQGRQVRVGVRGDGVRFAVWVERARVFAIVARDTRVEGGYQLDGPEAVLRAGARVIRLAHDGRRTHVRYVGGVEIEGWIGDDDLVDRAVPHDRAPAFSRGQRQPVLPGAVIRDEPQWSGRQLAVSAREYFLDVERQVDERWREVSYEDDDVRVRGFVDVQGAPGRVHLPGPAEEPTPIVENAIAAAGTCLYAREGGEPIGYVVIDQHAALDAGAHAGWFQLALDTPLGPIAFVARGVDEHALATCGPVPAATTPAAAVPATPSGP